MIALRLNNEGLNYSSWMIKHANQNTFLHFGKSLRSKSGTRVYFLYTLRQTKNFKSWVIKPIYELNPATIFYWLFTIYLLQHFEYWIAHLVVLIFTNPSHFIETFWIFFTCLSGLTFSHLINWFYDEIVSAENKGIGAPEN